MAASDVEHRVQKSPAAAQRPPHLRALEVLASILNMSLFWVEYFCSISLRFLPLGAVFFRKHVKTAPSPSKAVDFGIINR